MKPQWLFAQTYERCVEIAGLGCEGRWRALERIARTNSLGARIPANADLHTQYVRALRSPHVRHADFMEALKLITDHDLLLVTNMRRERWMQIIEMLAGRVVEVERVEEERLRAQIAAAVQPEPA